MLLSEDELLNLKRSILKSMAEHAPLECSEDAIVKAALVAYEHILEGLQTALSSGKFADEVCPTCGESGAVTDGELLTCLSCDKRWKP